MNGGHLTPGPVSEKGFGNLLIGRKGLTAGMQIQPVLMTAFWQMGLCAQPVHSPLEQREPPCRFGFHERFSFAFFTFPPSFGNEQPTIAERPHVVRQILMRFSVEHVVDPVRSSQLGHQAVGIGTRRTGITALVETHMRMVLEKHAELFFQTGGEGLSDLARIPGFEAMDKS